MGLILLDVFGFPFSLILRPWMPLLSCGRGPTREVKNNLKFEVQNTRSKTSALALPVGGNKAVARIAASKAARSRKKENRKRQAYLGFFENLVFLGRLGCLIPTLLQLGAPCLVRDWVWV
jgi:hypothetical protein